MQENNLFVHKNGGSTNAYIPKAKAGGLRRESLKLPFDTVSEACQVSDTQGGDSTFSGPVPVSASSGFAWAKRRKGDVISAISDASKSQFSSLDASFANVTYDLSTRRRNQGVNGVGTKNVTAKPPVRKQQHSDSFDASELYRSQNTSMAAYHSDQTVC